MRIFALLAPALLAMVFSAASRAAAAPARGQAAPAASQRPAAPAALDHDGIHAQYNEGNFDAVISDIEAFMRRSPTYSHDDSVFIAKHLAVVYTANPATRERGKYYMHRLLELLPSAKLVDMYVSEEIDRIFDKIREEFMTRHAEPRRDSAATTTGFRAGNMAGSPGPKPAEPAHDAGKPGKAGKGGSNTGFWIAGGAVAVAAGLAAAYVIHQNEEAPDNDYFVPKE